MLLKTEEIKNTRLGELFARLIGFRFFRLASSQAHYSYWNGRKISVSTQKFCLSQKIVLSLMFFAALIEVSPAAENIKTVAIPSGEVLYGISLTYGISSNGNYLIYGNGIDQAEFRVQIIGNVSQSTKSQLLDAIVFYADDDYLEPRKYVFVSNESCKLSDLGICVTRSPNSTIAPPFINLLAMDDQFYLQTNQTRPFNLGARLSIRYDNSDDTKIIYTQSSNSVLRMQPRPALQYTSLNAKMCSWYRSTDSDGMEKLGLRLITNQSLYAITAIRIGYNKSSFNEVACHWNMSYMRKSFCNKSPKSFYEIEIDEQQHELENIFKSTVYGFAYAGENPYLTSPTFLTLENDANSGYYPESNLAKIPYDTIWPSELADHPYIPRNGKKGEAILFENMTKQWTKNVFLPPIGAIVRENGEINFEWLSSEVRPDYISVYFYDIYGNPGNITISTESILSC